MKAMKVTYYFLLVLLFTLLGCEQKEHVHREQIVAMGTVINITIANTSEEAAHQAVKTIAITLTEQNNRWHAWQPSTLSLLNQQLQQGKTVSVDQETAELLNKTKQLSLASNSLFNPAIGELVALWGFQNEDTTPTQPPAHQSIEKFTQKNVSMANLSIQNQTISSNNPALRLDLGGFAKGYAVDKAIEALKQLNINNAIVNAGGDLRAIGSKGSRPWRVGIRNPRGNGVVASLEIENDESIITSGDYERYFEYQGQRYTHLIDPRTGYPAKKVTAVTVLHNDAATADAAATALFVAGPTQWKTIARALNVTLIMMIFADNTIVLTPGMAQRIRMEGDPPPEYVIESLP
ncbi:FAD:protein FMN transferase [hydrothermal vent metagenome]|uniref:FAD:protein FMN transferase n=1 Tax=hydrothermal vent metagenome TaxID=652676 RepID=A0A3B0ZEG8_9ZZZZ